MDLRKIVSLFVRFIKYAGDKVLQTLFGNNNHYGNPVPKPVQLTEWQINLCKKLKDFYDMNSIQFSKSPEEMFQGCLFLLEDECENNPDRIAQAAHSLREMLHSFLRQNKGENREKIRLYGAVHEVEEIQNKAASLYDRLSKIAHHSHDTNMVSAVDLKDVVAEFEQFVDMLKTQPEQNKEIDKIL